ncbi:hypothetical protein GM415_06175 [Pseudodesulfovibrio cashew]|uniref:Uncharacterized protein n=1 Tax=Pseudodesulfovibrio cashew TaxID=2678688 RepID=A0A6I6JF52_9BACT|nr:hypothetical protein [Pseudodesulfovibrio cashew]QGY39720.1 hypothetical protein GM415_06175 [Pseudodesulfovibrio cashew]
MGMNEQATTQFEQGLGMVNDMYSRLAITVPQTTEDPMDSVHEEQARLRELDAQSAAAEQRKQARQQAAATHETNEHSRARANAAWGQSGLAMSGSSALVRDSQQLHDRQLEEDLLFEGEAEARQTLNQGRHEANLSRISQGLKPNRSTLSLGSSIYRYGR